MAIKNDSAIQAHTSPLKNNTSLLIIQQKGSHLKITEKMKSRHANINVSFDFSAYEN